MAILGCLLFNIVHEYKFTDVVLYLVIRCKCMSTTGYGSSDPTVRWCTSATNKQKYQHRTRRTVNRFNPCTVLTSKNPRRLLCKKRYSILYRYRERGFEVFCCLFMWRGVKAVVPWARGGLPAARRPASGRGETDERSEGRLPVGARRAGTESQHLESYTVSASFYSRFSQFKFVNS